MGRGFPLLPMVSRIRDSEECRNSQRNLSVLNNSGKFHRHRLMGAITHSQKVYDIAPIDLVYKCNNPRKGSEIDLCGLLPRTF